MADYGSLVEYVTKSLVAETDQVQVTSEKTDDGAVRLLIKVAQSDIGRMIGRKGATINAIRQIVRASAVKAGDKVEIDVAEDRRD